MTTKTEAPEAARAPKRVGVWRRLFPWLAVAAGVALGVEFFYQRLLFPGVGMEDKSPYSTTNLKRYPRHGAPALVTQQHQPQHPSGCTVVFFHGNGETVASRWGLGRTLAARGHSFVAMEYRGYGQAREGRPSEDALYADAEALLQRLVHEGHRADRTVLWGYSLGSGIAAEMAARGYGRRLILESAFTSIPDVAAVAFSWLPLTFWIRDRFATESKAGQIRQPTLLLHGERDPLVPAAMARRLEEKLSRSKLVLLQGAGHNDLWASQPRLLFREVFAHLQPCQAPAG